MIIGEVLSCALFLAASPINMNPLVGYLLLMGLLMYGHNPSVAVESVSPFEDRFELDADR